MTTSPQLPHRAHLLDAVRGFALAGIIAVNIADITEIGAALDPMHDDPVRDVLDFTVQTRFVPVFAFLFGMGLWFVQDGARRRGAAVWAVLVRRLVALFAIGALLWLIYPGNILAEYGVVGLVVMPFVLLLPRLPVLLLGAVGTVAAYVSTGGGVLSLPGLMLLGAGSAAFGLPWVAERGTRWIGVVFGGAAVAAVPAALWQTTTPGDPRFTTPGGIAGVVMAIAYTAGFALLWHTPAQRVLAAVFEPLGRMALTNFVAAAVIAWVAGPALDLRHSADSWPVIVIGVLSITVQSIASRLWLRRFTYGPVEWSWRVVTRWGHVPVLRRPSTSG